MLNVSPAAEYYLRRDAHFSVGEIGALYFIELATMGLATFPAYWWIGKLDETRAAQIAYAAFIVGSLLSPACLRSFALLSAARAATGAGAGTLMVLGMTAAARAPDRNRMYALITFAQLASGAVILYLIPALATDGRGLSGVFYLSALLGGLGLATAKAFGSTGSRAAAAASASRPGSARDLRMMLQVIAFAAVFNVVVGGLWAFAAEYASAAGVPQDGIAFALAFATAFGMAGAAAVYAIGDRSRHRTLLLLGFATIALGASLLHLWRGDTGFAVGCCVLSFGWNFCVPHVLAAVASVDTTHRAMASMNLAFALGLAAGPLLAGVIIESAGLGTLLPCALGGLALGILLMIAVTRDRIRPVSASTPSRRSA